jgi:hypothetical protein
MSNLYEAIEQFSTRFGGQPAIWVGWSPTFGWVVVDRTREGNESTGVSHYLHFERIDDMTDDKIEQVSWGDVEAYQENHFVPNSNCKFHPGAGCLKTRGDRWPSCGKFNS